MSAHNKKPVFDEIRPLRGHTDSFPCGFQDGCLVEGMKVPNTQPSSFSGGANCAPCYSDWLRRVDVSLPHKVPYPKIQLFEQRLGPFVQHKGM